jgi:2-amino-4,5-dihydroxy-6-oxo-7-(phosphonooxy)heptanoate synthase
MANATLTGSALRFARLSGYGDGRLVLVPLDHSVSDGPITAAARFNDLVRDIVGGGADGIVVHKGRARLLDPTLFAACSLIVHLSASTVHGPDSNAKVLVADVEEALRLGADGVSIHVNIGSDTEAEQLADMAKVADACDRWGMPLLAMIYPRGPRFTGPATPEQVAHVVTLAAELGADLVKTVFAQPTDGMADAVAASPLPVLVAGGSDTRADLGDFARTALATGCQGLAIGRRVFTAAAPGRLVRELVDIVHGPGMPPVPFSPSRMAGVK